MALTHVEDNGEKDLRATYERRLAAMRLAFETDGDGRQACRARSDAIDELVTELWARELRSDAALGSAVSLIALGGYGRRQLFPASDLDLLLCTGKSAPNDRTKEAIRRLSQALWDCGLKLAPVTRTLGDCERFKPADPEFSLALLDLRQVSGDVAIFDGLRIKILERRSLRDARALAGAAAALTRERHARFGHTLFHLEPNVKDAPGGLRDAHVCVWLAQLRAEPLELDPETPFAEADRFLTATRVFLHLRHGRDDNTLDWHAQDEAAARGIGIGGKPQSRAAPPDPGYWMRVYFRHARAVERALVRALERTGERPKLPKAVLAAKAPPRSGFFIEAGVLHLKTPRPDLDPAGDSDIVLAAFGSMAETGVSLAHGSEERITAAIPALSTHVEDGPRLWARLQTVLKGPHAATALREMHALGVLELILPEFHGIDALVIRDAYHRYTVDEHTFVLLAILHALGNDPASGAPEWRLRFGSLLHDLSHPELLFLAALLHDTGKGRAATNHATASAALATEVCARLELGSYESGLVVRLIEIHLEMSAALRRDIFDSETVRVFAEKVGTHDLLRMLALFTYADISAVHPDALTPWKAENLWRLFMATSNQLDRSVDEERVHAQGNPFARAVDPGLRSLGRFGKDQPDLERFLEGFPERYLRTRTAEVIHKHMLAAREGTQIFLSPHGALQEITVVTRDRSHLFADLTAALASWGLEVVTAEAFSNAQGTVVDSFRFLDTYRTLELNPEEHDRFLHELYLLLSGELPAGRLQIRQRSRKTPPRRSIETRIEFDQAASSHSTLMQIVARDTPGLLRTIAQGLSDFDCSVEVALIDTEGEVAIDVFYLTRGGERLGAPESEQLRERLSSAIAANAQ